METYLSSLPGKLLLTMEEAAEVLSVGRTLMYELVMKKRVYSVKVGRLRRVPFWALEQFVAQLEQA